MFALRHKPASSGTELLAHHRHVNVRKRITRFVGDDSGYNPAAMKRKVHPIELLSFGKLEQSVSREWVGLIEVLIEITGARYDERISAGGKVHDLVIAVRVGRHRRSKLGIAYGLQPDGRAHQRPSACSCHNAPADARGALRRLRKDGRTLRRKMCGERHDNDDQCRGGAFHVPTASAADRS